MMQADVAENMVTLEEDWHICQGRLTEPVADEQKLAELKDYMKVISSQTLDPQVGEIHEGYIQSDAGSAGRGEMVWVRELLVL
jgi:hypothetical protein